MRPKERSIRRERALRQYLLPFPTLLTTRPLSSLLAVRVAKSPSLLA